MIQAAPPPPAPIHETRILSLGDSYTIGESVKPDERWPVRLAAMLRARGIRVAEPVIVARTGWTTDELSAGIEAARPVGPYDVVTLLIGVNNQYRGRPTGEFRSQFRALLERAVQFAGGKPGHVVVVSIPDWAVTPFGKRSGRDPSRIASEIDAFNAVARDETVHAKATFVDITPESREAATRPELVAGDGLHPSSAMYEAWVKLVLPVVLNAL